MSFRVVGEAWAVVYGQIDSGQFAPEGLMTREEARAFVERRRGLGYKECGTVVRINVREDGSAELSEDRAAMVE